MEAISRRVATGIALGLLACSDGPAAPVTFDEQFEVFWSTFDRRYPFFPLKQVDWDSVRAAIAPRVPAVGNQAGMIQLLREAAFPLRDEHVIFESPDGVRLASYNAPFRHGNYSQQVLESLAARYGWQDNSSFASGRVEGVPYLALRTWLPSFSVEAFDKALAAFRNDSALIIDVRMNRGGYDAIAYQVAGRFTSAPVVGGYAQTRVGPDRHALTAPVPRLVTPRGPWAFQGRIVLLTGRLSASATESFVAAMREMPGVTVVGDTTAGTSGNPLRIALADGWTVGVPSTLYMTADSMIIESHGVPPDRVHYLWPDSAAQGRDTVLEAAVRLAACGSC